MKFKFDKGDKLLVFYLTGGKRLVYIKGYCVSVNKKGFSLYRRGDNVCVNFNHDSPVVMSIKVLRRRPVRHRGCGRVSLFSQDFRSLSLL